MVVSVIVCKKNSISLIMVRGFKSKRSCEHKHQSSFCFSFNYSIIQILSCITIIHFCLTKSFVNLSVHSALTIYYFHKSKSFITQFFMIFNDDGIINKQIYHDDTLKDWWTPLLFRGSIFICMNTELGIR